MYLDAEQIEFVRSDGPSLMCIAGPGSGKTRVLIESVCQALTRRRPEQRFAVLTFTRAAAAEARARLAEADPASEDAVFVGTFHSLAMEIVAEHWQRLGYASPNIVVLDAESRQDAVDSFITDTKPGVSRSAMLAAMDGDTTRKEIPQAARLAVSRFHARLRAESSATYDMLISEAVRAMIGDQAAPRCTDVWVDEVQDMDSSQLGLLMAISPRRLIAVGDPDQSIYGWRGSDPKVLHDLKAWLQPRTFVLTRSYRCSSAVIAVAGALIRHNPDHVERVIESANGVAGDAAWAAPTRFSARCAALLSRHRSVAVICRTNRSVESVAAVLRSAGIQFSLARSGRLLETPFARSVFAYLAWPMAPRSWVLAERVLISERCGGLRIAEIRAECTSRGVPAYEIARSAIPDLRSMYDGFDASVGMVERLVEVMVRLRAISGVSNPEQEQALRRSLAMFIAQTPTRARNALNWMAWSAQHDAVDTATPDGLVVTTAHASKGLEYDAVVVMNAPTTEFPHAKGDLAEERRLMFVACTRARHELCVIGAGGPFVPEMGLLDGEVAASVPG